MKAVWTLASKELKYYLNNPLGYVSVIPFIFISYFLYYRSTLVVGTASLRPYFDFLPWFLVLLVPALTMQTLAEEKNRKTLELILAHPVSQFQIVWSKFLGSLIFYLLILLVTGSLTLPLFIFSKVDGGVIFGQYLGALFTGAAFLAISIFASSLAVNIISSFLGGAFLSFLMIVVGLDFIVLSAPHPLSDLLAYLSINRHSQNVSRGLLEFSDLTYFATLTGLFLIGAVFRISQSKIAEKKSEKSKLIGSFLITLVVGVLLNLLSTGYRLRLDLTSSKLFSLSKATKLSLAKINDVLNIKVFISPDLPPSVMGVAQEVRDMVSDYGRYNGKIKIENFGPKDGNEDEKQAQSIGVNPVQFNTIGASSYQLQKGYLGLVLRFGEKTEILPFIQTGQNLEYILTNRINKLTAKKERRINFYSSSSSVPTSPDAGVNDLKFNRFLELLSSQYNLEGIKLDKGLISNPPDLLIIAGLNKPLAADEVENIKKYLSDGGKAILLLDKVGNDNGNQAARTKITNLENLLQDYGITANSDLVYDLGLAETIQFSRGPVTFLTPYPFWFKSLPADSKFSPTAQVRSVTLLWPSSLSIISKGDYVAKAIIKTSNNANFLTGESFNISPDKLDGLNLKPGGKPLTLGAVVNKKNGDVVLAVLTDSKFISDDYFSPANQNLSFAIALTDFLNLSADEIVPFKAGGQEFLVFTAPWQPAVVQWGETVGVPLLIALFAAWHLWRRRQGYNRTYEKLV